MGKPDRDDQHDSWEPGSEPDRPPEFVEKYALLRQIFFERHFRKAVVAGILLFIAVPLFVKKWWVASPPSIKPPIKVSGLDKVQAWSLRRSARKYAAAGRLPDAVTSWRLASSSDACDPENSRGLLRLFLDWPSTAWEYQQFVLSQAGWLLRLTSTNAQDLILVGAVAARFEHDDVIASLFLPQTAALTPDQARILIPALYRRGDFDMLAGLFERHPEFKALPDLRLYHAAWDLGWGPRGSGGESRRLLQDALEQPGQRDLARRLILSVNRQLGQEDEYKANLDQLEASQADHVSDHVNYWQMLLARGNTAAVVEAIRGFNKTPRKSRESLALASIFVAVGQVDEAIRLLERHRAIFPGAFELWVRSADLLSAQKRWEDLRVLGSELRRITANFDQAAGYSYFLEAVSFLNAGNQDAASRAFNRIEEVPLGSPYLGYVTASGLTRLGRIGPARALLGKLEKTFGDRLEYWQQVQLAAYEARDIPAMLEAVEKAYRLAPDNMVVVNNYAAALLILRQRPAEAIQLTLRRLQTSPNDPGARINHALALLQNRRMDDAEKTLKSVPPEALTPMLRSILSFAWFELHAARGRAVEARAAAAGVDVKLLMPTQRDWFDAALRALP